jgi:hypothetical protein
MDPRFSEKKYPRKDVVFKSKSSYNFEALNAKIYLDRKTKGIEECYRWLIHAMIGIMVGTIAFLMTFIEEELTNLHTRYT